VPWLPCENRGRQPRIKTNIAPSNRTAIFALPRTAALDRRIAGLIARSDFIVAITREKIKNREDLWNLVAALTHP
jgi:hypothetical protein